MLWWMLLLLEMDWEHDMDVMTENSKTFMNCQRN